MTTCGVMTSTWTLCTRNVAYKGMVCTQHQKVLMMREEVEKAQKVGNVFANWAAQNDWHDPTVADLFGHEPPSYDTVVGGSRAALPNDKRRVTKREQERENEEIGTHAALALVKGIQPDVTCTLADGSGRWQWSECNQCWGQHDACANRLVKCRCNGCAGRPKKSEGKTRKPMTMDHCICCTCKQCVCPARIAHGLCSQRALTAWWDNPCGGTCRGCEKVARIHAAGAARGWTS